MANPAGTPTAVAYRAGAVAEWLDPGRSSPPPVPGGVEALEATTLRRWLAGVHPLPPSPARPDPDRLAPLRASSTWSRRLVRMEPDEVAWAPRGSRRADLGVRWVVPPRQDGSCPATITADPPFPATEPGQRGGLLEGAAEAPPGG